MSSRHPLFVYTKNTARESAVIWINHDHRTGDLAGWVNLSAGNRIRFWA
jgi:hypothetical protein